MYRTAATRRKLNSILSCIRPQRPTVSCNHRKLAFTRLNRMLSLEQQQQDQQTKTIVNNQLASEEKMSIYSNQKHVENNVVLCNCEVISEQLGESEDSTLFLKHRPRGPYTTMRTIARRTHIFQLNNHIQRLIDSTRVMLAEERQLGSQEFDSLHSREDVLRCGKSYSVEALSDASELLTVIKNVLRKAVDAYETRFDPDVDLELKLTVLIVWDRWHKSFDVFTHVVNLSERPDRPVLADIRRGSRTEMKAKDSIWIELRDSILDKKSKQSNEVLMCEDDGHVREGLSSNFFVVKSGYKVCTANEGILDGTVKQLIDKIAADKTCDVVYNNEKLDMISCIPTLHELSQWKEAFVTSTSRQILPIYGFVIAEDCIQFVDDEAKQKLRKLDNGTDDMYYQLLPSDQLSSPYAQTLQNELTKRLLPMSTRIVDE